MKKRCKYGSVFRLLRYGWSVSVWWPWCVSSSQKVFLMIVWLALCLRHLDIDTCGKLRLTRQQVNGIPWSWDMGQEHSSPKNWYLGRRWRQKISSEASDSHEASSATCRKSHGYSVWGRGQCTWRAHKRILYILKWREMKVKTLI